MWKYHTIYHSYRVYRDGRIYSEKFSKFLSTNWKDKDGYLRVNFKQNGQRKHYSIHRLVAEMWIENPNNLPEVNHIDGNKENNSADNLEWITKLENRTHALDNNLTSKKFSPRKVFQYSLDGNLLGEYETLGEAEKLSGIDKRNISACILGKRKTTGGFIWKTLS